MIPTRSFSLCAVAVALCLTLSGCGGLFRDHTDAANDRAASQKNLGNDATARMAQATLNGGDPKGAISLYEQVLKRNPDDLTARLGLGEALLLAGETERARLAYAEAATRAPTSPEPLLAQGRIACQQRHFEAAESFFIRAQSLAAPDDARPVIGLGTAYDLQGRHGEAQTLYRKAMALQPENTAARSNLGLSLALDGRPREAVNILLDIATTPSAPPQTRQNLALAYGLTGNTEAAENILNTELDRASVQSNLKYYQFLRERMPRVASASPAAVPAAGSTP